MMQEPNVMYELGQLRQSVTGLRYDVNKLLLDFESHLSNHHHSNSNSTRTRRAMIETGKLGGGFAALYAIVELIRVAMGV